MHHLYMFFLCLFACTRMSVGLVPNYCLRSAHSIANERQAIMAARNTWYCISPDETERSEQAWSDGFAADREGANWVVTTKLPQGHVGPMIEVKLTSDGHVQDVRFSQ